MCVCVCVCICVFVEDQYVYSRLIRTVTYRDCEQVIPHSLHVDLASLYKE